MINLQIAGVELFGKILASILTSLLTCLKIRLSVFRLGANVSKVVESGRQLYEIGQSFGTSETYLIDGVLSQTVEKSTKASSGNVESQVEREQLISASQF